MPVSVRIQQAQQLASYARCGQWQTEPRVKSAKGETEGERSTIVARGIPVDESVCFKGNGRSRQTATVDGRLTEETFQR